ncbi:DNA-binding protein [Endozoicomonas sp. SM1973]|uniref:DNA-binding protein n=2 Tax=Spartinivicinus marinus TaxID=2994442 RepID=A0A853ICP6_9GAMM|nr:DNA-binding protein [Spartinivicinus marinus]
MMRVAMMETYEFVLKFKLSNVDTDPEQFLEALYEQGCDDALVGVGRKGVVALDFAREAESAEQAVMSAVSAVLKAIPGAELFEAGPDLINLSDLAELMGCSRQNAHKHANADDFPMPVVSKGRDQLWHYSDVLEWLNANQAKLRKLKLDSDNLSLAKILRTTNLVVESNKINPEVFNKAKQLLSYA